MGGGMCKVIVCLLIPLVGLCVDKVHKDSVDGWFDQRKRSGVWSEWVEVRSLWMVAALK